MPFRNPASCPRPSKPASLAVRLCVSVCLLGLVPAQAAHFHARDGAPDLRSESAVIADAKGRTIYAKKADQVRPIASITKVMTAMVVLDLELDLDHRITITRDDRDLIQLTGSRLEYGAVLSRKELLTLALMSSENRAATALGRTAPGGLDAFVQAMNDKASSLGMEHSYFFDPAGLSVENRASASDLLRMLRAAHEYPLIRQASTRQRLEVRPYPRRGPLVYGNTNRLLKNPRWDIGLSKTGYIMEAGRCLVMHAEIEGETVFIVLLNSYGKLTPFGDSNRLMKWLTSGG